MPSKRNTPEYLEEMQFSKLVRALDDKWAHTYEDPHQKEQPETSEDMRRILDKISELQGDQDPPE